jgi:polyhydroxyalkanoate synthesis repressor PhaR
VNSKNRLDSVSDEDPLHRVESPELVSKAKKNPRKGKTEQPASDEGSVDKRVIKKYPNRRLYDTSTSSYITLSEVKELVMQGVGFLVIDAKTQKDLTRTVLLQVILEEETAGAPMFSAKVLENMIRFYGHAMQAFMGNYLEQNIQSFVDLQMKMTQNSKSISPELWVQVMNLQTPMLQGMMGSYTEESKQIFQKMQDQLQEQLKLQTEKMVEAFNVKLSPRG